MQSIEDTPNVQVEAWVPTVYVDENTASQRMTKEANR
jgi:hypothetical protein